MGAAGKIRMKKARFSFLDVINIMVMVYLLLPIAIIVLFSFNPNSAGIFPMKGFSVRWYVDLVHNMNFLNAARNSVYVALAVATLSTIVGTLASFALTRYNFRFKAAVSFAALIPIALPGIILGIALLSFFSYLGLTRSLLTVIIGHAIFCIPFAIITMNSRMEGFDVSFEEAARDLGANSIQTFRLVTFPLIRPSLIGTMMLTFGLSFDEFLVTFFVIGRDNTLPIVIWSMLRRGVSPLINAAATIILVVSIILIIVANRFVKIRSIR
jgi:spermidine/putrescine transport system permease protein